MEKRDEVPACLRSEIKIPSGFQGDGDQGEGCRGRGARGGGRRAEGGPSDRAGLAGTSACAEWRRSPVPELRGVFEEAQCFRPLSC